jgi:lycopene cyclase domain-containing protein
MAAYLLIDLAVCAVLAAWYMFRPVHLARKRLLLVLAAMLLLTVLFDNLIIAAGIVAYDIAKILGVYLAKAPVEDFFYAIVAAAMVPYLWTRFGKQGKK